MKYIFDWKQLFNFMIWHFFNCWQQSLKRLSTPTPTPKVCTEVSQEGKKFLAIHFHDFYNFQNYNYSFNEKAYLNIKQILLVTIPKTCIN